MSDCERLILLLAAINIVGQHQTDPELGRGGPRASADAALAGRSSIRYWAGVQQIGVIRVAVPVVVPAARAAQGLSAGT